MSGNAPKITNNEIRFVRSLAQKKGREESGCFVVEGEKMVAEALASGFGIRKIYRIEDIGTDAMSRISALDSPSPVLAVVSQPELEASSYEQLIDKGLYLALDGLRDPGNLGTIIRIADWFGIDAIFVSDDTVETFNPKVVQATMGAIFRVKVVRCSLPLLADRVLSLGGNIYGTFLDGENMYSQKLDCGEVAPSVIVIGNESRGISAGLSAHINRRLFIPPYPSDSRGSESLNAAVATAVTVAEFRRRQIH
ncbi:MAG: TrmH family RNA methyltransferase [Candidatus Cryptobacteroides sp.]